MYRFLTVWTRLYPTSCWSFIEMMMPLGISNIGWTGGHWHTSVRMSFGQAKETGNFHVKRIVVFWTLQTTRGTASLRTKKYGSLSHLLLFICVSSSVTPPCIAICHCARRPFLVHPADKHFQPISELPFTYCLTGGKSAEILYGNQLEHITHLLDFIDDKFPGCLPVILDPSSLPTNDLFNVREFIEKQGDGTLIIDTLEMLRERY